ncbi:MAG: hypothetical protein FJ206_13700 [Gemmatimonadetes bacterium]|nr:hypothetical protein [Gemmatimonadota bacterium]
MTGISLAKKGVHELKTAALGPVPQVLENIRGELLNFRLDGRRIGHVKHLRVTSEGRLTAQSVQMAVQLDREQAGLEDCHVASDRWGRGNRDARFRCVTAEDIDDENLEPVGEVTFEPGRVVRPLHAAQRDLRRLNRSSLRGLDATLDSEDGRSMTGEASFDLQDRHGSRERGTVRIDATDGRALIEVRDQSGREIFRLKADDNGVSLNANDKRGRGLLRLLAGESGVEMKIDAERQP